MYVILLGPPGVGKGTQGVLLADHLGWDRVVTGDLLRAARSEGTPLGQQAQQYMDRGELVPDGVIIDMVREQLSSMPAELGAVFDGFPRTDAQASALTTMLGTLGREIHHVVVLQADDEVLVKRISGRRSCPKCGSVYNIFLNRPQVEGVCDKDGTELTHRADDQPETVRHRLEVYRELTEPLIKYYSGAQSQLHYVDGAGSLDEIQSNVRAAIGVAQG
jgi:adenylate kinase